MAITVKWEGGTKFTGQSGTSAKVTMEAGPKYGGSGEYPTPMELVGIAYGACTGIDIILIMQKMRVTIKALEVEVQAKRREEPPAYYEEIKLLYTISGDGVTADNTQRAVELSHEKYCSVGAMLEDKAKISYEIKIV